jgi:hypothetical protein
MIILIKEVHMPKLSPKSDEYFSVNGISNLAIPLKLETSFLKLKLKRPSAKLKAKKMAS